jgi:hypothetical protein
MNRHYFISLGLGVALAGGCSTSPKPDPTPSKPAVSADAVDYGQPVKSELGEPAHTAPADDAAASRDAVNAKAQRYAMEMEKAATARAAAATKPPAPQPSQVDWSDLFKTDPSTAPATPASAAPQPSAPAVATAEPVAPPVAVIPPSTPADETPTMNANTTISLDGVSNGGPMVIPEGQEIGIAPLPAPVVKKPTLPEDASLAAILAKRVKENPRDLAAQLDYQLYQFTLGQSVPQLAPLAPLPTEDREVVAAVMDALSNFRTSAQNDANQLLSKKIRPLVELGDRLKAQADLTVPTLLLCRRVDGFGVYDPIEPAEFPQGREVPVILYCEVANFSSQKADGKQWETTLSHSATLYKESGVPVWSDKTTNVTDHSRNRRHDFFIVKMMHLPSTLPAGRYVLKVTVVDRQSNRIAEGSTTLTIVAPATPSIAKTE